jgi:alkaline phosphatase
MAIIGDTEVEMPRRLALVAVVVAAAIGILLAGNAGALTIYPIDRAEILLGSRFDVRVEFDGVVSEGAVTRGSRDP